MDFPSLGDADSYMQLGQACAQYLSGGQVGVVGCYNAIRPLGISLYYSIPYLITNDAVLVNYITLLMNLIALSVLLVSGVGILRRASGGQGELGEGWRSLGEATLVLLVLLISVGFIPVRLSDHQSLACFMASLALLAKEENRSRSMVLLGAGALAGGAVLLKQNYIVSIFFLIVFWLAIYGWHAPAKTIRSVVWFSLGAAVSLIQVAWVYYHSGVPWFYEPVGLEAYAPSNRQPSVELVAYTLPFKSAYLVSLAHSVTEFEYFSIKFYRGLMEFYWSVYLGEAPLNQAPERLVYSARELVMFQLFFILSVVVVLASFFAKSRWLAIVVATSFCAVVLATALNHAESRYFYQLRFAFLIFFVYLVYKGLRVFLARTTGVADGENKPIKASY